MKKAQLADFPHAFSLEMAARRSAGQVNLSDWRQGAALRGHKVEVPEMKSQRQEGNTFLWEKQDSAEHLPIEPDALFTLQFSECNQATHFFYEADRGTMNSTDMLQKLRAYFH